MDHLNEEDCINDSEDTISNVGPDVNRLLFDMPIILHQENHENQDGKYQKFFELQWTAFERKHQEYRKSY